jgi:hypothetical protein
MAAGTDFDPQLKRRQIGLLDDGFKTKAQCVLIDGCNFANPDTDFARIGPRMEAHLGSNRFQHRIRDSHLVHNFLVETRLAASPTASKRDGASPVSTGNQQMRGN